MQVNTDMEREALIIKDNIVSTRITEALALSEESCTGAKQGDGQRGLQISIEVQEADRSEISATEVQRTLARPLSPYDSFRLRQWPKTMSLPMVSGYATTHWDCHSMLTRAFVLRASTDRKTTKTRAYTTLLA